jgi:uncharacterized protein (DUF1015 family)
VRIHPFNGLTAASDAAQRVASVPYDVVTTAEASALAKGNPDSFLHVVRSEIDLSSDVDVHSDEVYAKAAANLSDLQARRLLVKDSEPCVYVYRIRSGAHQQTGLLTCAHVDDYENGIIKKHELTRKDKEDDRTRHILSVHAQSGPVLLTYRDDVELARMMDDLTSAPATLQATSEDGVEHEIWRIPDPAEIVDAFSRVPEAYIADGHHRSASAARARAAQRDGNAGHNGDEEYNWFLVVLFPASELRILAYNRLIRDLNGHSPAALLELAKERFDIQPAADPTPIAPRQFGVYLDGRWWTFQLKAKCVEGLDAVDALDCSLLQAHFIEPILGIEELRTDPRIGFAGGHLGPDVLQQRVDTGEAAIAISMYPTSIDELIAIADADAIMPPKSTWFDPKLRSGLVIHTI